MNEQQNQQKRVDFDLFNPTEDHKQLRQIIQEFAKKEILPLAHENNKNESFDLKAFRKLGELGILGITVPEEFGGAQMDASAAVTVCEELSYIDPGFCLSYLAHSILCTNNLAINGSEEQKRKILPLLCSGEWVGALAMSESHIGTDVFNMKTFAQRKGNKKEDGFIINGQKMWITNAIIDEKRTPADCVWLYAQSGDEKNTTLSTSSRSLSTFLVQKNMKGFTTGQMIKDKAGMRSSYTGELLFNDCEVPYTALIGKEGDSAQHMMRNLEIERVTLAAMSLGIAKRSLEIMNQYANERTAFSKSINQFGQIQKYIATSYSEYMAAASYVYNVARSLKLEALGQRLDSDAVKLFASRIGKKVADRAIQVLGAYGYVGEYTVERLWRDAKLLEIGGGTSEALEKNITSDLKKK